MQNRFAVALSILVSSAMAQELSAQKLPEVKTVVAASLDDSVPGSQSLPTGPIIEIMALDADGTNLRTVAAIPNYPIINSPEVSPDGEWIGVDGWKHGQALTDAHLLLVHLKTGIVSDLGIGAMPTWSADGRWIAFSRYGRGDGGRGVYIGRVNQEQERLIDQEGWGITWSPDGQTLAFVRGGDLVLYDVRSGTRQEVFGAGQSPYRHLMHNPEWSPDSRRICILGRRANGNSEFATVSAEGSGPDLQVCCDAEGFNPDIGWSKDGKRLTFPGGPIINGPGQLWVYDFEAKGKPNLLMGQPNDRNNLGNDWSPDGKTLYFLSVK